ncbi:MAG TPA: CPBP family intramembrane glutamic endopeptidase [Ornithinibacter sp.]|nr:CPBP family intramembrane glutamic endopeptidase [Ornithinibacter sp.]
MTPSSWGVPPVQLGERRVLHPGRRRWLRALAWLALLFFLTAGAFGLPLQWAVDHLPVGNAPVQLAGLVGSCVAALGCYALAVRLGEGRAPGELALRPALGGLAVGAGLGLLMMGTLMGVLVLTGAYSVAPVGAAAPWAPAGLALQAAVTEELWMRALLFRLLWRVVGPRWALVAAAAVFAALHLANPGANVLAGATVATAGVMFCALFALTGRLWVPIGLHLAWNLAQGYLFGAAVSGGDLGGSLAVSTARAGAPVWLTGGPFGPEASVVALVLVAVVTVVALLRVPRNGAQSERLSNTSRVAVDRFMVMKWMPGAPSSSIR